MKGTLRGNSHSWFICVWRVSSVSIDMIKDIHNFH